MDTPDPIHLFVPTFRIDEVLAATYPYDPAYLPVNRKLDGTVHSW